MERMHLRKSADFLQKKRGAYEKLEESAGQKLEYAFDFMEIAFGASQE